MLQLCTGYMHQESIIRTTAYFWCKYLEFRNTGRAIVKVPKFLT
uniref:Uncharacterized protein n=1 Tax=Sinorhizobium fredii (strain HH103) TaxID=1117943 RepID=A0A0A8WGZ4_SINF1|nr:hypothetical protein [Sinorhizobium fredii HH103]